MADCDPPMYQSLQRRNPEDPPPYHPSAIKQWASRVLRFSSQYNSSTWSADMTLGHPRVYPNHGDIHGAWATAVIDANQFIELEYEIPVCPSSINIYETYHPGSIVCVEIFNDKGKWETLWSTNRPVKLTVSRIFSPPLKETRSKTTQIRLKMNCMAANSWCEIDAVELVGVRDGAVAPVDDTSFVASLQSLVNNKEFSDVKFETEGKKLYAHKAILAARSSYFANMLKGKNEDKVVLKIPTTSHKDMETVFHFIYTNRLPSNCSIKSLISLLPVSSLLGLPEMKTAVMYRLLESMTVNNVVDTMVMLSDSKNEDVQELCMKFVADHLAEVSKAPGFDRIPQAMLVQIVQTATANMCVSSNSAR